MGEKWPGKDIFYLPLSLNVEDIIKKAGLDLNECGVKTGGWNYIKHKRSLTPVSTSSVPSMKECSLGLATASPHLAPLPKPGSHPASLYPTPHHRANSSFCIGVAPRLGGTSGVQPKDSSQWPL